MHPAHAYQYRNNPTPTSNRDALPDRPPHIRQIKSIAAFSMTAYRKLTSPQAAHIPAVPPQLPADGMLAYRLLVIIWGDGDQVRAGRPSTAGDALF
jgi:hypothetical protein